MKKKQKKQIFVKCILIAVPVLLLVLALFHPVEVREGEEFVVSYPRFAAAGSTVRVETVSVSGGELSFSCSADEVKRTGEGLYEFRMPARKVTIYISVITDEERGFGGS